MSEKQLNITPPRSAQPANNISDKLPVPVKAFSSSKSRIYQALLSRRVPVPGPQSSTPVSKANSDRIMAAFRRVCDESTKSAFCAILDNDSGYVSHHHESNFDSSSENGSDEHRSSSFTQPMFISEDALLEKPEVGCSKLDLSAEIDKEDYEEASRLFNTSDIDREGLSMDRSCFGVGKDTPTKVFTSSESIIVNSFVSDRTNLSGLDTDVSDVSLVIPTCEDIVVKVDGTFPVMDPPTYSLIDFKEEDHGAHHSAGVTHLDEDMELDDSICGNNVSTSSKTAAQDEAVQHNDISSTEPTVEKENIQTCHVTTTSSADIDKPANLLHHSTPEPQTEEASSTTQRTTENAVLQSTPEKAIMKKSAQKPPLSKPKSVLLNLTNSCELSETKQALLYNHPTENKNKYRSPFKTLNVSNKENIQNIQDEIAKRTESPVKRLKTTKVFMPSPDLFSDGEDVAVPQEPAQETKVAVDRYALRCDTKLLRRVQNGMSGVIPPPSVTMTSLSVDEMLSKLKEGVSYFWDHVDAARKSADAVNVSASSLDTSNGEPAGKSLLVNCDSATAYNPFPEVMKARYHGLHHNRGRVSEELEHQCGRYAQRYVGMETQSSCTVFEVSSASPRKRPTRPRWGAQSPGRRLSHLARRRITFSSANLQAASTSFVGNRTRQIMIDARKLELLSRKRSPRKTPKKTPPRRSPLKSRTPSSSAKKKLAMRFRMVSGEIEETYSNCSSVKSEKSIFQDDSSRDSSLILPSVADERRRLLSLSSNDILNKKRKRTDSDCGNLSKLAKMDMKSTREEMKTALSNLNKSDLLNRSSQSGDVVEMYKKKLQWTVYEALRSQNITSSHPEFKTFASTLARVIRRFLPSATTIRPEDFNEKMLKLARYNVYAVIKGKTVDEIIAEYMKAKQRQQQQQQSSSSQRHYHGLSQSSVASSQGSLLSQSSFSSQSLHRRSSETRSSFSSSSSSNKENLFRTKSPTSCTSRSHLMLRNSNCSENRINRIRKVINFGDDNR